MASDESLVMLHIAATVIDNQAILMSGLVAIATMCVLTSTDDQRAALDKLHGSLTERVQEMTELAKNLRDLASDV